MLGVGRVTTAANLSDRDPTLTHHALAGAGARLGADRLRAFAAEAGRHIADDGADNGALGGEPER